MAHAMLCSSRNYNVKFKQHKATSIVICNAAPPHSQIQTSLSKFLNRTFYPKQSVLSLPSSLCILQI